MYKLAVQIYTESMSVEELENLADEKPAKLIKTSPRSFCNEADDDKDDLSLKQAFLDCSEQDSKENVAEFIANIPHGRTNNNIFEVINGNNVSLLVCRCLCNVGVGFFISHIVLFLIYC